MQCKRRSARRLSEYALVVKPSRAFFVERCFVHVHDSGVGWKQFMILLVGVLSPQLMVALKSARRLAISAARSLAKRCLSSGVTLVSPLVCRTKGLPCLNGGLGHELAPSGAVLSQGSPVGKGRREV